jgi:predicted house-cleaning noncanonical NTP pyrophosphatase (MazG superfamily)
MDIFSIDVTHNELNFIRQALDTVQISGKDAKFLANLQTKIEHELANIQQIKQQEEQKKLLALSQTVDSAKNSSKK